MGENIQLCFSFDELSSLELCLLVFQNCIEQCSDDTDSRSALQVERDTACRLLQRVKKAIGRDED